MMPKVPLTLNMTRISKTIELIILTRVLADQFNRGNIKYFNTNAIINELKGKSYPIAFEIFKGHFENFVYIRDNEYLNKMTHLPLSEFKNDPKDKVSIIYDAYTVCQIFKKNHSPR